MENQGVEMGCCAKGEDFFLIWPIHLEVINKIWMDGDAICRLFEVPNPTLPTDDAKESNRCDMLEISDKF